MEYETNFCCWTIHNDKPSIRYDAEVELQRCGYQGQLFSHPRDSQMYGHNHFHFLGDFEVKYENMYMNAYDVKAVDNFRALVNSVHASLSEDKLILTRFSDVLRPIKKFYQGCTSIGRKAMVCRARVFENLDLPLFLLDEWKIGECSIVELVERYYGYHSTKNNAIEDRILNDSLLCDARIRELPVL
jgi:hypothetical protein